MNTYEHGALRMYGWLMILLKPLLRVKLARRARTEPGYALDIAQRFGDQLPPRPTLASGQALVWIHAVSLGETRAAAVLLRALREALPGMRLLLTHTTATGRFEGVGLLCDGDVQAWIPWDTPGSVQRFLAHYRPSVGVLMETEIWPHLVAACRRQAVPLLLANARLSEKSFARAQQWPVFLRPAYTALAQVLAQSEADAQRLRAMGAPAHGAWGNLKFDASPNLVHLQQAKAWRCTFQGSWPPVVMLASSREGEELQFLQAIQSLELERAKLEERDSETPWWTQVRWLLVPRHPQRFDEVAQMVRDQGFDCLRRSQWGANGPPVPSQGDPKRPTFWLGDSLGEMALYYGMADVALLGGSFEPLGGQNLIEAAACACPLVLGPHTHNFAEAAEQALAGGAAVRVTDMSAGLLAAAAWLRAPDERMRAAVAGMDFVRAHQGAANRMAGAVARWASTGL